MRPLLRRSDIRLVIVGFMLMNLAFDLASPTKTTRADTVTCYDAAVYYGTLYTDVSVPLMQEMITQESRGNPNAVNPQWIPGYGHASGCAQFVSATFYRWRAILNADTSYAPGLAAQQMYDPEYGDLWSPMASIHIMAYMLHRNQGCQWTSYARITRNCPGWSYSDYNNN